mmetsp:Transcript_14310/g.33065  ORF Transcript_14310/g.33065 Transcript_14310/m.33065 type:complete len:90 (-) Transcript_14310:544-813(-)
MVIVFTHVLPSGGKLVTCTNPDNILLVTLFESAHRLIHVPSHCRQHQSTRPPTLQPEIPAFHSQFPRMLRSFVLRPVPARRSTDFVKKN